MNRWAYYLVFWMESGLKKFTVESGPVIDWHCKNNFLMDCHPAAVIQFEKLFSDTQTIGTTEALKIAEILDKKENMHVVDEDARPCVYREVAARPEFFEDGRNGTDPSLKKFTHVQLQFMKGRLEELISKFSQGPWLEDYNARITVRILEEYANEVQAEYMIEREEYYSSGGGTEA